MRTTATDEARVAFGELATRLDDRLTLVLGLHWGREIDHILSLVQNVVWRV